MSNSFQDNLHYAVDLAKKAFSVVEVYDNDAISQSIESIILTSKYERVFNPSYGSTLNRNIFKQMTDEKAESILDYVIGLILKWEKRILIDADECGIDINVENHIVTLTIKYRIKNNLSRFYWLKKIIAF